jgi:hypothetical protein
LLLQSQAKHIFAREAFKSAVWVGAVYATPDAVEFERIIIIYDPKYSENEVWKSYRSCEENNLKDLYQCKNEHFWARVARIERICSCEEDYLNDPDQSKLERAWGRRIKIERIFEGIIGHWEDVEALFYAETLHGDFNCRVLRNLRSVYHKKAEVIYIRIKESLPLVKSLVAAAEKESTSSSKLSQQANEIAEILNYDIMDIIDVPKYLAKKMGDYSLCEYTLRQLSCGLESSQVTVWHFLYGGTDYGLSHPSAYLYLGTELED